MNKMSEGLDLPISSIIRDLGFGKEEWNQTLCFRSNQEGKANQFRYLPQELWKHSGTIHTGKGFSGTLSMLATIQNFDAAVDTMVMVPVLNGDTVKVQALLLDTPDLAFFRNEIGKMPLHAAAEGGHIDMVNLLLANKADVNAKSNDGNTPLFFAANKEVAELLLANHADVNARSNAGGTPLLAAASAGRVDVVDLLLTKGVDINTKDNNGETSLILAAMSGHKDVVELLLTNHADVNAESLIPKSDKTYLILALEGGFVEFFAKQADANVEDAKSSATALDWAVANGFTEIAGLLRQHGAKMWEPSGATEALNAACGLIGTIATQLVSNRIPRSVIGLGLTYATVTNQGVSFAGTGVEFVAPNSGRSHLIVSKTNPIRVRLSAPALPISDRPKLDIRTRVGGKGKWEIAESSTMPGLIFESSNDGWGLSKGEVQFSGSVAMGSSLVVFLTGEVRSTSPNSGSCTDGTVAQVSGIVYQLNGVWELKQ